MIVLNESKISPYPASKPDKKAKKLRLINWYSEESKNIGTNTNIRDESVSIKDDNSGKVYTMKTLAGKSTAKVSEAVNDSIMSRGLKVGDLDGVMTDQQIADIKKLIKQGANDLSQQWKSALELTNKAMQVMQMPIPLYKQKEAWSQYLLLLTYSVQQLARTRGLKGKWRMTQLGLKR